MLIEAIFVTIQQDTDYEEQIAQKTPGPEKGFDIQCHIVHITA